MASESPSPALNGGDGSSQLQMHLESYLLCHLEIRMTQTELIHYSNPTLHPSNPVLGTQARTTVPPSGLLSQDATPSVTLVLPGLSLSLHFQVSADLLRPQCLFHVPPSPLQHCVHAYPRRPSCFLQEYPQAFLHPQISSPVDRRKFTNRML